MSKKSDSLSNRVINISPVVYVNSHKKYNEDLDQLDSITITIKNKNSVFPETLTASQNLNSILMTEKDNKKLDQILLEKMNTSCRVSSYNKDEKKNLNDADIIYKRNTLQEIRSFIEMNELSDLSKSAKKKLVETISINIFRPLIEANSDYDPDEDPIITDPSWIHVQFLYFVLFDIVSKTDGVKFIEKFTSPSFIYKLIRNFNTPESREREILKEIVYKIYSRVVSYRRKIRYYLQYEIYDFIYNTGVHWGIVEILELLGSIIDGFAVPIRLDHLLLFSQAILPLHIPSMYVLYHRQLEYCIITYLTKMPDMIGQILHWYVRYWPISNSKKIILYLEEIENILIELQGLEIEDKISYYKQFLKLIVYNLNSDHFQVVQKALFIFLNSELHEGVFSKANFDVYAPYLYHIIKYLAEYFWCTDIYELAEKVFSELNLSKYTCQDNTLLADV